MNSVFQGLSKSKFRKDCKPNEQEMNMLRYSYDKSVRDTRTILKERLGAAFPRKDGQQTPYHGQTPCFVAQHATATCCRSCLEKWHHIPKGKELTKENLDYMVQVIERWFKKQLSGNNASTITQPIERFVRTDSSSTSSYDPQLQRMIQNLETLRAKRQKIN